MTPICRSVLLLSALLLPSGAALAQTMPPPMSMPGSCSGTVGSSMAMLSGKVYLVNGNTQINPTAANGTSGVFGLADCQCKTRDILMRIILDPSGVVPRGALVQSMGVPIFIGAGNCESLLARQQSVCDTSYVTTRTVADFQSTAPIDIPIPAEILSNPQKAGSPPDTSDCACQNHNTSQTITVGLGDPQNDISATCKLSLPIRTIQPPSPDPSTVKAQSGNNSLTLSWSVSTQDNQNIQYYQILCRKAGGDPAKGTDVAFPDNPYNPYYSTCLPCTAGTPGCVNGRAMHRGIAVFSGSTSSLPSPSADGGAGLTRPMVTTQARRAPVVPEGVPPGPRVPLDVDGGGASDGGADLMSGADGGSCTPATQSLFQLLDPRYLCSGKIQGSGPGYSARVEGLDNGVKYELMVVSIDYFGNPSSQPTVVTGTPLPTYNLLEGLRSSGNQASGFCSAAGAGPEGRAGQAGLVLPWVVLLGIRPRRRRAGGPGVR